MSRDERMKQFHERKGSMTLLRGLTRRVSSALFSLVEPKNSLAAIAEDGETEADDEREKSGRLLKVDMGLDANH